MKRQKDNWRSRKSKKRTEKILLFLYLRGLFACLGRLVGFGKRDKKKETLCDKLKDGDLSLLGTAGKFIDGLLTPITNGIPSLVRMLTGSGISELLKARFEGFISSGTLITILVGAGFTWGLSKIHESVEGVNSGREVGVTLFLKEFTQAFKIGDYLPKGTNIYKNEATILTIGEGGTVFESFSEK